jgi:hypothetical protein
MGQETWKYGRRWQVMALALAISAGCDSEPGLGSGQDPVFATGGVGGVGGAAGAAGTAGTAGSAGIAGAAGSGGLGDDAGLDSDAGPGTGPGSLYTAAGYVDLAPATGAALDPSQAMALTPAAPEGYQFFPIEGAKCRDGSSTGIFVKLTDSDKLMIFLEGGGACTSPGFCNYNPASDDKLLTGDGQTVIGSTFGVFDKRQEPGAYEGGVLRGVFDESNAANPVQGWNKVYVPYCTGDVHGGTRENVMIPGVAQPQQFVGHLNMQKFIARLVPTFEGKVNTVLLTGVSAGSFGTALNFSMVQDAFKTARVFPLLDSGLPFTDEHWPVCLQKKFRDTFGLNAMLPPDCAECFNADGSGMLNLADFLMDKHPQATLAAISASHDEVIRLFFSAGLKACAGFDTADPVLITLGQFDPAVMMPAADYEAALVAVRDRYAETGRVASYMIGGGLSNLHQHIFRARFYEAPSGGKTIAAFVKAFLEDEILTVEAAP